MTPQTDIERFDQLQREYDRLVAAFRYAGDNARRDIIAAMYVVCDEQKAIIARNSQPKQEVR